MNDIEGIKVRVTKDVTDALEYIGHKDFEVFNSGMKVVITLFNGETCWFMYNPRTADQLSIYGAVLACLMHRNRN